MGHQSINFEMEGLEDLYDDIQRCVTIAPKEMQKKLNSLKNRFKKNMIERAKKEYKSTEHITSGFMMTQVEAEQDKLYSYFKPEARGNKGHAWHLQERGYELRQPMWWSRKRAIKNSAGKKLIKFIPGHHLLDKEMPGFTEFMAAETKNMIEKILSEVNL